MLASGGTRVQGSAGFCSRPAPAGPTVPAAAVFEPANAVPAAAEAAAAKHPQNRVSVGEIVSSPPPPPAGAAAGAARDSPSGRHGSGAGFSSRRAQQVPEPAEGCPSRWCRDAEVSEKVRARAARSG